VVDTNLPRTREELGVYLEEIGVQRRTYDLFGGRRRDNEWVLDHRDGRWIVVFTERGDEWGGDWFDDEAGACAALLAEVTKYDHAFFQLVAGPAPKEEADRAFDDWLAALSVTRDHLAADEWKFDDVPWVKGPFWRRYFVRGLTVRRLLG